MKKNTLVAGAILLVVGLALCLVTFSSVGFDARKLGEQVEYEQKQFSADALEVRSLRIDDENNTIELSPSTDGKIAITYYESGKDHYELGVDDAGALVMRYVDDRRWYERIGYQFGRPDTRVTVAMPAGFGGDLTLRTVNGAIDAKDLAAGSLEAVTTNGDIRLGGVSAGGEVHAGTVNGQIALSRLDAESVVATTVNGRIQLETLRTKNAISLTTTNGSISGSISGNAQDYAVNAGTVNGSNNLANSAGGAKPLSAHTTNGSIDIQFTP